MIKLQWPLIVKNITGETGTGGGTGGGGCVDSQFFTDCNLIIENRYCSNLMYAKFCCQSCLLAGQLDPIGVAAASRGTRSIKSKLSIIPPYKIIQTNTA